MTDGAVVTPVIPAYAEPTFLSACRQEYQLQYRSLYSL